VRKRATEEVCLVLIIGALLLIDYLCPNLVYIFTNEKGAVGSKKNLNSVLSTSALLWQTVTNVFESEVAKSDQFGQDTLTN